MNFNLNVYIEGISEEEMQDILKSVISQVVDNGGIVKGDFSKVEDGEEEDSESYLGAPSSTQDALELDGRIENLLDHIRDLFYEVKIPRANPD